MDGVGTDREMDKICQTEVKFSFVNSFIWQINFENDKFQTGMEIQTYFQRFPKTFLKNFWQDN